LSEQSILGHELRPRAADVPGGTDTHLRRRAGWSKQALDCPDENAEQEERVHGHDVSGCGLVNDE
jgi:hypothetical protein